MTQTTQFEGSKPNDGGGSPARRTRGSSGGGTGNATADGLIRQTEEFAREEPLQAVGIAFVSGLVLTLLPIGSILFGLIRLSLALVRPALLTLGAVKAYEELSQRQQD